MGVTTEESGSDDGGGLGDGGAGDGGDGDGGDGELLPFCAASNSSRGTPLTST